MVEKTGGVYAVWHWPFENGEGVKDQQESCTIWSTVRIINETLWTLMLDTMNSDIVGYALYLCQWKEQQVRSLMWWYGNNMKETCLTVVPE